MEDPSSGLSLFLSISLSFLLFVTISGHSGSRDEDYSAIAPYLRSRTPILVKILCLILVFVGTFAGGFWPHFLKWSEGFLVLGTYFAGGVFLDTALMHFLSESNETFEYLTEKGYPFAFMLAGAGFLMTMLADCAICHVYGKRDELSSGIGDVAGHWE